MHPLRISLLSPRSREMEEINPFAFNLFVLHSAYFQAYAFANANREYFLMSTTVLTKKIAKVSLEESSIYTVRNRKKYIIETYRFSVEVVDFAM